MGRAWYSLLCEVHVGHKSRQFELPKVDLGQQRSTKGSSTVIPEINVRLKKLKAATKIITN